MGGGEAGGVCEIIAKINKIIVLRSCLAAGHWETAAF